MAQGLWLTTGDCSRRPLVGAAVLALLVGSAFSLSLNPQRLVAQSPTSVATGPTFDVASVKENRSGQGLPVVGLWPGGRFGAPNVTLRELVRVAYGVEDIQLEGGPPWIGGDRFEISAITDSRATAEQARAMLRTLLAERFKLAVRMETRDLPVYALVTTSSAGNLGRRLRRSGSECASITPPPGVPAPPPPPAPPAGTAGPIPLSNQALRSDCGSMFFPGYISARQVTLAQLAVRLSQLVSRPVIDRTGLAGPFDLDLIYAPEGPTPGAAPPNAPPGVFADALSIFTALQEQLGLKLESQRGPVEMVIIDRAERPAEN